MTKTIPFNTLEEQYVLESLLQLDNANFETHFYGDNDSDEYSGWIEVFE